jgi:tetratricopeptide (TPR) repeat protein
MIDEGLKNTVAQMFFFLGITYRQINLYDDSIQSYLSALQLNQYYSDCYFNLGNVYFEEKKDYSNAEICYKSALEALEEER